MQHFEVDYLFGQMEQGTGSGVAKITHESKKHTPSKKTHCVTHVCNTHLGGYIENTVCYTVTTHCVTHYTVCYIQ